MRNYRSPIQIISFTYKRSSTDDASSNAIMASILMSLRYQAVDA